jgi:hypothetical protein
MATTTNYGWTTPDDTALVKDGAAAIRTLGTSVDTTTAALNPSTTLGDIEYRSSTANTNTRLPLGTAGQVLTVNSGATAPEWATSSSGGMTLLSTTTLSGATVTISGISGSYTDLIAVVFGVTNATGNGDLRCAPNGSTTITDTLRNFDNTTWGMTANEYIFLSNNNNTPTRTDANNSFAFRIYNYASTTSRKPVQVTGCYISTSARGVWASGQINTTSAITSLVFSNQGGNLSTGTVLLYGVK